MGYEGSARKDWTNRIYQKYGFGLYGRVDSLSRKKEFSMSSSYIVT